MRTWIKNARIIDGTGAVLENAGILFDESGILAVGTDVPETMNMSGTVDAVVDGSGKTVLPGLIDCHVHLGLGALTKVGAPEEQAASMLMQFRALTDHGITTVRSMSTADDCDIKLKKYLECGYLKGPRLIACGRGISITGGHGWLMNYEVDTVDETRKAARTAIRNGADLLKMFATGGMGTKGSIPNAPQLSEEQMRVICEEADRAGILTAAHCTGIEGAQRAIRAGVRCIEHIQMDEETAQLMKEKGSYYCPTIVTRYNIIHSTEPEYAYMRAKAKPEDLERKKKAIGLCLKYGIPVCAGTDAIGTLHNNGLTKVGESLLTELSIYHEYGMTPMQVIRSATLTAAKMLRIDEETGSLEAGKCADLIVVEGNPLEDIGALGSLCRTYRAGELLYQH